ncbi:hypothetical protein AB0O22_03655 [Streptomyces sp. NPDC091204]|uniref:hypothetical protein n=1 Tax=Streptomyces sp. NPDC091204 TaxID=3155299 RepID=UPI0034356F2B
MAGMRIVVCLPGEAGERLDEAVGEALAPFWTGQDRDVSQDLRIWDHWRISGGAEGVGFRIRPGCADDPRIVRDRPGWAGTVEPALPGWCAGGPRGLLVVGDTRKRAVRLAGTVWDGWQDRLGEHPPGRPWEEYEPARLPGADTAAYTERCRAAHAVYLAQTPAAAFREWAAGLSLDPADEEFRFALLGAADPRRWLGERSREEFVAREALRATGPSNLLTRDGWWWEEGSRPVHGACDDPATCPHTPPSAPGPVGTTAHLARLPADTLLVSVRCHV